MRSDIVKVVSGIGILIAIYLFLSNGMATTNILNSISSNAVSGIQVLQGRQSVITK